MAKLAVLTTVLSIFFLLSKPAFAADQDLVVNEIMYDFPGSDTGHEWVELFNSGNSPVTIIGGSTTGAWRINDGANHLFSSSATLGSMIIEPGQFAIIAQNTSTFLADNSSFSGNLIGSSGLSLGNISVTVGLRIGSDGSIWGQAIYQNSQGANDDGNSLQRKTDGSWLAAAPTPGSANSAEPAPSPSPSPTSTTSTPQSTPKSPSPTPSPKSSPTQVPKPPTPSPIKSPVLTPPILGESSQSATPSASPSPTPSPTPQSFLDRIKNDSKTAIILIGSGLILIGLSSGFYVWYSKLLGKPVEKPEQD